jgi:transcriptional regulator GlxA family with amidase domain
MNPIGMGKGPSRRLRRIVSEAQAFMGDNLDRELSLTDIARSASLSPYYFTRLFTQVVGMPPYRYLLHLRVARAKQLLGESELNVSQISRRVGFRTPNHFSMTFRRLAGMSPTRYRRLVDWERMHLDSMRRSTQ